MNVLTLNLGTDRPENPALLQQSGARLLRTEGSGKTKTWVISGPGSENADGNGPSASASPSSQAKTTYWVDTTGHLQKFAGDLGGRTATITIEAASGFPARIPPAIYGYLRMKG